ncbi:MAG TPA: hypothetical protein VFI99_16570 [Nocardioides sp.]|jgi:hypothetical protein|nr:hypothetical protein [Nocardioides sp.]
MRSKQIGDSGAAEVSLADYAATNGDTAHLTVDPDHAQGWQRRAHDDAHYLNSHQAFLAGPGTPPLGDGTLKMSLSTADNAGRVGLFRTGQYDGTPR